MSSRVSCGQATCIRQGGSMSAQANPSKRRLLRASDNCDKSRKLESIQRSVGEVDTREVTFPAVAPGLFYGNFAGYRF